MPSPTEEMVAAAYRLCKDEVRRGRDLDIAEWLGLGMKKTARNPRVGDGHLRHTRFVALREDQNPIDVHRE
jgi:hypothetical protein